MVTSYLKNYRILLIMLISAVLFFVMTCVSIAASYFNTIQSVRLSIANQSMKAASFVASQLDTRAYQAFLENPVKENPAYKQLEKELAKAREQFGALFLYISKIDADQQGGRVMIASLPPDLDYTMQIGEPCYINAEQIQMIVSGQTYYSDVISDPIHGKYLSAGAPLLGESGQLLGIVGVDMDVLSVDGIGSDVVRRSVPLFLFQGLFVAVLVFVILGLQRWYQQELKAAVGDAERTYQDELRSVISSIRSVRHDFINHIQVLYGLIEFGYFDKAREYVKSLLQETKLLDISVRISNPALMILFHTKWEQAKSRNIVMQFAECPDQFDEIPSIDLIKLMSNLIDNALDAAASGQGEKWIRVACKHVEGEYRFEIENSGPEILREQMDKLFDFGYSTKHSVGGRARGAGLCIVQSVVKKHGGRIEAVSSEGVTKFTVHLPLRL
ncbi:sensor histidine kinase [Brevibacillus centrosporus]|uniref:sensor histidine kinase n=1 Tax=Brevibacillus centrosporus TaxID=54910 RepID=UPI003986FD18